MSNEERRQSYIESIRSLPQKIEDVVRGLDDEKLDTPYGEGKWTVRQVVHHLADSHVNANARLKLALTEDCPTLKPYDQDRWAALGDMHLPIQGSLGMIRGLHERWAVLLDSLSDEDWLRKADHPEDGEYTVDSLIAVYAEHGEKHLKQVTDLCQRMGW